MLPTPRSSAPTPNCTRRGRPRSISNGRSTKWFARCARCRHASAPRRPMRARRKSARKTWRSTRRSAATGRKEAAPVNILTPCNAGWLAAVDVGTALAPVYTAHDAGVAVHVWVDETRPRNQGASLTAWELYHHGVPHRVVADNTGGHLMQHGLVDLV